MKLGILVNTDRHLRHILEIVNAATSRGHTVLLFAMDDGARLLSEPEFAGLCGLPGVSMGYCDQNARQRGIDRDALPAAITCGSQYNNAIMNHEADRVIVL